MPPTHYELLPPRGPARAFETIAEVAEVLLRNPQAPGAVVAVTGRRQRRLSDAEKSQLVCELRARRLSWQRRRELDGRGLAL